MCPVVVMLTCDDPQLVQNIQITYICTPPFECSESTICLDGINGTEIIESQVFITNLNTEISEIRVEILFTITDDIGKIVVLSRKVLLPISLYCVPTKLETEHQLQLNIHTNYPCIEFSRVFTGEQTIYLYIFIWLCNHSINMRVKYSIGTHVKQFFLDFSEEELYSVGNSNHVTLQYRSTKKIVTLKATENYYSIQANDFPEMTALLDHFIFKLLDHFSRMGVKDFQFNIKIDKELFKQMTFKFLKSVEIHAKDRLRLKDFEVSYISCTLIKI